MLFLFGFVCRPYVGDDYALPLGIELTGFMSEQDADDLIAKLQNFFTSLVAAGVAHDAITEHAAFLILMPLTLTTMFQVLHPLIPILVGDADEGQRSDLST